MHIRFREGCGVGLKCGSGYGLSHSVDLMQKYDSHASMSSTQFMCTHLQVAFLTTTKSFPTSVNPSRLTDGQTIKHCSHQQYLLSFPPSLCKHVEPSRFLPFDWLACLVIYREVSHLRKARPHLKINLKQVR